MASVYTEEVSRSRIARRLSILPAVIGLIGVGLIPLGTSAAGITDAERGWSVTGVAVSLVLATVMSGASFGLYLGLATVAVAGLAVGGPPTRPEILALGLTLFVVHETVRFSLDARRPTRFGPGLIGGYLARSALTGLALIGATTLGWALADRPAGPAWWLPLGLAAGALPLFVQRAADFLDRFAVLARPTTRAALAGIATAPVLAVVVIAAKARTAIESTPRARTPTVAPATTTTTAPELVPTDPASLQRVLVLIAAIVLVLVFGVLYLALRRPEALFELDELDADLDGTSFGIALPGQADQHDEIIEVDDQDLTRLLQGLRLDISDEADPARAIRFGYANIERALGDMKLTRQDSETEREFLVRALPALGSAGTSMTALTRLFERARFGQDRLDESMRQEALLAVSELLAEVAPETEPENGPAAETGSGGDRHDRAGPSDDDRGAGP